MKFDNPDSYYHYRYQRAVNRWTFLAILITCILTSWNFMEFKDATPAYARYIIYTIVAGFVAGTVSVVALIIGNIRDISDVFTGIFWDVLDWLNGR